MRGNSIFFFFFSFFFSHFFRFEIRQKLRNHHRNTSLSHALCCFSFTKSWNQSQNLHEAIRIIGINRVTQWIEMIFKWRNNIQSQISDKSEKKAITTTTTINDTTIMPNKSKYEMVLANEHQHHHHSASPINSYLKSG